MCSASAWYRSARPTSTPSRRRWVLEPELLRDEPEPGFEVAAPAAVTARKPQGDAAPGARNAERFCVEIERTRALAGVDEVPIEGQVRQYAVCDRRPVHEDFEQNVLQPIVG